MASRTLYMFYDGWCPVCTRSADLVRRLDVLQRVTPVSFRDPGVIERHGLDLARLEQRMQCRDAATGTVSEGIDAVIAVARRVPALWPALPLLALSRSLGVGGRLYDFIARRRRILPLGHCGAPGCRLDERRD